MMDYKTEQILRESLTFRKFMDEYIDIEVTLGVPFELAFRKASLVAKTVDAHTDFLESFVYDVYGLYDELELKYNGTK